MRKAKPLNVSESSTPSVSIQIPPSDVRNVDPSVVVKKPHSMTNKPRSVETLGQSSMNAGMVDDTVNKSVHVSPSKVVGSDPVSFPTKTVIDPVVGSPKETLLESDVVPDVSTSLAQPSQHVETIQETPHIESEYEPAFENENSQSNMITNDGEEKKVSDDDGVNSKSIGDEKDASDGEDQSLSGVEKGKSAGEEDDGFDGGKSVSEKDESGGEDKGLSAGIAKRLENRKWKAVMSASKPPKASKKNAGVGPAKSWSKGCDPCFQEEIFEKEGSALKRLALERELGKDALECKEVVDLIEDASLMKNVAGFGNCYEMLVKEFIINIPKDCDSKTSKEYMKVYVRGKSVEFSPEVINRFIGRSEEDHAEVEVTDNAVCKEITAKYVKQWPRKGKLSASRLSVKYVVLHRNGAANWVPTNHTSIIATGLGRFTYIVGTKTKFDFGYYVFEQTMKHVNSFAVKMPIAFPSLICGLILSQHPDILVSSDVAYLAETIKSCTEKKIRLKNLIKALSKEDADGNLYGDEEEGNEDEGNDVIGGDKDEDTDDN
ncbi:envelope-like protein, partial [Trifolium medium]|nr:envelope-like protein [Trifolium medium]